MSEYLDPCFLLFKKGKRFGCYYVYLCQNVKGILKTELVINVLTCATVELYHNHSSCSGLRPFVIQYHKATPVIDTMVPHMSF